MSSAKPSRARGRLRIGDDWNAITIIALSQSSPLKAIAELVENSIDAKAGTVTITRGREHGRHFLAIRDDGEGVPRDGEGRPDFRYVATHISRPGVILQTGALQRAVIGEYDGRRTPRVEALHAALVRAGIEAEISPDIRRTLWEKYTFLVGLSGTTATMRMPIGAIRSNLQTRAFLLEIMKETVAVGRALGVALPADYAENRLRFADSVPADMTSSMHHDLERGNRLEVEWLSGGVVQLGMRARVPTPANRAVWDILALHALGRGAH